MKPKSLEIFDRFYNAHWFLTGFFCRYFSELLREGGNKAITTFIGVMNKDVNYMIFDSTEFDKAARYLADKVVNDNAWFRKMYRKHDVALGKFFKGGEELRKLNFKQMTDQQIVSVAEKNILLQEEVRILGVMLNGLVLDGRNHLSNKLRQEIQKIIKRNKDFDKDWMFLTRATILSFRQKKDLEIAHLVALRKEEAAKALRKIYDKYCWLDYMYYGPPASFRSYQNELKQAIKHNQHFNLREELQNLSYLQKNLMRKLKFPARAKYLIKVAQSILWHKAWRKDVEYHGFYCYEPMFKEIARRKKEKNWRNLLYMFPWELKEFVLHDKPSLTELKARRDFSCLIVKGPTSAKILTGRSAKVYYDNLGVEKDLRSIRETRGQSAYAGRVSGNVKIVQVPADMYKMQKGNILVSQATSPDLILAIKKSAAIVTNTGGLICHAAIISRELKIPCVVGTKNATLIFKDGDMIEVDADKGIVRKI